MLSLPSVSGSRTTTAARWSWRLAQTRLEAYSRLWEISGIAAPTRLDGWGDDGYLLPHERRDLWAAMTDWYYANGNGMLQATTTRWVYLNVRHDLICESSDLRPPGLADLIRKELGIPVGYELDDSVRGILAIRLVSLLRTQLKSELALYDAKHLLTLTEYERFFLLNSGVNVRSRPWAQAAGEDARWWWRLRRRLGVPYRSPRMITPVSPIRGLPQPSSLRGFSPTLRVGRIDKTPLSSRMAIRNALNGSVGAPQQPTRPGSRHETGDR